jgi:hypothetical protein
MKPKVLTFRPMTMWQNVNLPAIEPTSPDLGEVTRDVVETVLGLFSKGSFDWHEDSFEVTRLLFTFGILCETATGKRAREEAEKVAAINALEQARREISFDALKWPDRPIGNELDEKCIGHCTHRAKTILAKMIRELEAT